ncbi:hypothetical protein NKI77_17985 [Mesorhizobium opportunistum]|uniref:Uncharacterized protein n=1 Tax=Mesorhizobium opportunistum TaxID=593909 RepID=A0ABV1YBC5_9HYPH|nr:hypothetical protein [Mesorhizobium sp.]
MPDNQTIIDAVQAEIEADRDWLIGLTRDMVRIPSVNPKFEANAAINRSRSA